MTQSKPFITTTQIETVRVSYCGVELSGKHTASGERFDHRKLTCAHRTLPFGTYVKFTNPTTKLSVTCRVNDRGPNIPGRAFDLTSSAFALVAPLKQGLATLTAEVQDRPQQ